MVKIVICDDLKYLADDLKKNIQSHDFGKDLIIDCCYDGETLLKSALDNQYDIIIADIELSEDEKAENGIGICKKIKDIYPNTVIIYMSAYDKYYYDMVQAEPFAFIKKVRGYESEVIDTTGKALKRVDVINKKFYLKRNGAIFGIKTNEILYAHSALRKIYLKLINEEKEIEFYGKLDEVEKVLCDLNHDFIRISKSYLVNYSYISDITSNHITMHDKTKIDRSRRYKYKLDNYLMENY